MFKMLFVPPLTKNNDFKVKVLKLNSLTQVLSFLILSSGRGHFAVSSLVEVKIFLLNSGHRRGNKSKLLC